MYVLGGEDERRLDRNEGVPWAYEKWWLDVEMCKAEEEGFEEGVGVREVERLLEGKGDSLEDVGSESGGRQVLDTLQQSIDDRDVTPPNQILLSTKPSTTGLKNLKP